MTESPTPLRVGVIGCGFFAQNHLHAWRHIPDVELVAVCDIEPDRARAAAEHFEVDAWFDDAARMLDDSRLDFVDIATTPPSHRELVALVAEHRLPMICQKPMALDLDDAEVIVDTVRRAGLPFMVHENFRWQAPMRVMRRHLDRRRDRPAVLRTRFMAHRVRHFQQSTVLTGATSIGPGRYGWPPDRCGSLLSGAPTGARLPHPQGLPRSAG